MLALILQNTIFNIESLSTEDFSGCFSGRCNFEIDWGDFQELLATRDRRLTAAMLAFAVGGGEGTGTAKNRQSNVGVGRALRISHVEKLLFLVRRT